MLDVRTLQFAATTASWTMGLAVAAILWRRFPRGIAVYAAALLLQALSQTVSLLRDEMPVSAAVLLSNLPLTVSFGLEYLGLSRFYGLRWSRGLLVGLPLAVYASAVLTLDNLPLRIALISAGYAVQHLLLVLVLTRVPAPSRNRPYALLVVVMLVAAAMFAVRGATAWSTHQPTLQVFAPSAVLAWSTLLVQVLFEINAVAVLLAVHHRDEDRITELVTHDALTSVDSRHSLFAQGLQWMASARLTGKPFSLLMIDFDRFKETNDRYGHHAGDQVLVAVTAAMRKALRPVDLLGRYGGEEFCALLQGADLTAASLVAERIRQAVHQVEVPVGAEQVHVTVSIGVATAHAEHNETFDSLMQRADRAMYRAKAAGRDCVRVHEG